MVKNKLYRAFLDGGVIKTLSEDDIQRALNNIKGRYTKEGRALLIALYYTGARGIELLSLKAKDIQKAGAYVLIKLSTAKRGLPRTIHLQYKKPLVAELYKYATGVFPEMYLFYNFRNKYVRHRKYKSGDKSYDEITDKLRYFVRKWFSFLGEDSISPYYLRHNRFSKLMESGASAEQIRILKGGRDISSVMPYLHLSSDTSKKLAKKID